MLDVFRLTAGMGSVKIGMDPQSLWNWSGGESKARCTPLKDSQRATLRMTCPTVDLRAKLGAQSIGLRLDPDESVVRFQLWHALARLQALDVEHACVYP
jgi:hypothetical protein